MIFVRKRIIIFILQIDLVIIVLCLYPLLTDDCLYIFYICTDNVNGWPQNKNICTKLFEECEQKLPADKDQQVQGQLVDNPIEYFLHKIMIYMSKRNYNKTIIYYTYFSAHRHRHHFYLQLLLLHQEKLQQQQQDLQHSL